MIDFSFISNNIYHKQPFVVLFCSSDIRSTQYAPCVGSINQLLIAPNVITGYNRTEYVRVFHIGYIWNEKNRFMVECEKQLYAFGLSLIEIQNNAIRLIFACF